MTLYASVFIKYVLKSVQENIIDLRLKVTFKLYGGKAFKEDARLMTPIATLRRNVWTHMARGYVHVAHRRYKVNKTEPDAITERFTIAWTCCIRFESREPQSCSPVRDKRARISRVEKPRENKHYFVNVKHKLLCLFF